MSEFRVYVGTYAKYNAGSIAGEWVELDGLDESGFYEKCYELHSDETDPEFMLQDQEGIPEEYFSESGIDPVFWEYLEFIETTHLDKDVVDDGLYLDISIKDIEEMYQGKYSSDEEFAEELANECGLIDESASWPMNCIDWERAARELMFDYGEHNGHYFRTSY